MIELAYGHRQQFRYRHADINVLGRTDVALPVCRAEYRLGTASPKPFYVKPAAEKCAAVNRLDDPGQFNIEIPVTAPTLAEGDNQLRIDIESADGAVEQLDMTFAWDPTPIALPLDLSDLSAVADLQTIGQAVNGVWEVDAAANVIRSHSPVASDVLLLLGSPHGSQEATYTVRFFESDNANFVGLSEFFAGHEAERPDVVIKPGWSSAGLATIRPDGGAQCWLAWGDLLSRPEVWVTKTDPPVPWSFDVDRPYRVRHQVAFTQGVNSTRFRIWPADQPEPDTWLCEESDAAVAATACKHTRGAFGLFQFFGQATQWSDIHVRAI